MMISPYLLIIIEGLNLDLSNTYTHKYRIKVGYIYGPL